MGNIVGLLSAPTYSIFLFVSGQVVSTLPPHMNSAIMLTAAMLGSVELPAAIINVYFIIGELVNGLQWLGMG
ncbi:hypothetical protein [Paenibacillus ferrarius]|nr:hypothetical protein [Paenibacillus ferrarius]